MLKVVSAFLPLPLALLLLASAAAQADQSTGMIPGVEPWVTLLATQGLAVVLVLWWIMKGYPDWLKDLRAQQELWRTDAKAMQEASLASQEHIHERINELTITLKTRPCQLDSSTKRDV